MFVFKFVWQFLYMLIKASPRNEACFDFIFVYAHEIWLMKGYRSSILFTKFYPFQFTRNSNGQAGTASSYYVSESYTDMRFELD